MNKIKQAALLLEQGKLPQAEALYREILQEQPDHGIALWGLGRIAVAVGHARGAIALFSRASQSLPDKPEPLLDLAGALDQCGRFSDAGSACQLAVQVAPSDVQCAVTLGVHLTVMGKLEEARLELRRALDLDPYSAPAWAALARIESFGPDSQEIQAMQALMANITAADGERVLLHYALGNQLHEQGDYAAAFAQLQKGNLLDRASCRFSVADMAPFFDELCATFGPELLAGCRAEARGEDPLPQLTSHLYRRPAPLGINPAGADAVLPQHRGGCGGGQLPGQRRGHGIAQDDRQALP